MKHEAVRQAIALVVLALFSAQTLAASPTAPVQGYTSMRTCSITIVAVSSTGQGVTGNLTVTVASPGRGRVYISTSPASEVDTQGSARLAAFAASLLAGVDMTRYDFFYDIESRSIIVGGPSAGFAMALATLYALTNTPCNSSIAVTGMIQPDTSIGPVGGLKEKLEAAAGAGKKLFLIPAGQQTYTYYQTVYKRVGPFVYVTREPVTVNLTQLGNQLGVRVIPVATLGQAYEALTGRTLAPTRPLPGEPSWVLALLGNYTNQTLARVEEINRTVGSDGNSYIRQLMSEALNLSQEAESLRGEAPYLVAVTASQALDYALRALYAHTALQNNLNVTGIVDEVNNTIQDLYNTLNQTAPSSTSQAEQEAKAWGKLGIATYYYQEALDQLDNENGTYRLRTGFFGTIDPTPLEMLADAESLASLARFWADVAQHAPSGPAPGQERLQSIARLLMAEARTAIAYTETLLNEAGARGANTDLAAFLAEQAMLSRNPTAIIGYSIEAISVATSTIHEVFTLDTNQTLEGLARVAANLYYAGNETSAQTPLLLEVATHTKGKTALTAASKAVLYSWLVMELEQAPGVPGSPGFIPVPITPSNSTGHAPSTSAGNPEPSLPGSSSPMLRPGSTVLIVAAAILLVALLIILRIRSGQTSTTYPTPMPA